MAEALTLPLLSLPDDEIIQKLREMDLKEVLKFSLISERSKELVKSAEIKGALLTVRVGSDIKIYMTTETQASFANLICYREPDMYWAQGAYGRKKKLTAPQSVFFGELRYIGEDTTSELEKKDYTMKEWLEHLQEIFHYRKIDSIWFRENSSEFDLDDIKEAFGTTGRVDIGDTGCHAFNQMILELFPIKEISIKNSSFPNSIIPEKVLKQNFVRLQIGEIHETTSMTLDELLLVNSKLIQIRGLQLPAKQFNEFIKQWQNGSNPHMEYLYISYPHLRDAAVHQAIDEEDYAKVIMEGIDHFVIPPDTSRHFKVAGFKILGWRSGGIGISRKDGAKATIQLKTSRVPEWQMFVWFDHCIVES
ncbi:unnamed protein product [Caenorhabditis brenneri]